MINHYQDKQELAYALAQKVYIDLKKALSLKGKATLCVPGGSTPGLFLEQLSLIKELDWSNIYILLNDERCVGLDDDRSNERLIRETLLINHAKKAHMLPLYDANLSFDELEKTIAQQIKAALPIDVCVLGMGADGHTASLFPNAVELEIALDLNNNQIVQIMDVPDMIINDNKEWRITLTLKSLLESGRHYLLITGNDKLDVLTKAKQLQTKQYPISYVLNNANVQVFFSE